MAGKVLEVLLDRVEVKETGSPRGSGRHMLLGSLVRPRPRIAGEGGGGASHPVVRGSPRRAGVLLQFIERQVAVVDFQAEGGGCRGVDTATTCAEM